MSSFDLGSLVWSIDADMSGLDAKLDQAEAKVRAWAARASAVVSGIGASVPTGGAAPAATFSGVITGANVFKPSIPGANPAVSAVVTTPIPAAGANPAITAAMSIPAALPPINSGTMWQQMAGGLQARVNALPPGVVIPGNPPPATPTAPAPSGMDIGRVQLWRAMGLGAIAARDVYHAGMAIDEGNLSTTLATTRAGVLQAGIAQQRDSFSGIFGGAAGLTLDLFGVGPHSYIRGATRTLATVEAQDALDRTRRGDRYGDEYRAAIIRGDSIGQRRILAQRNAESTATELNPQIEMITKRLAETDPETYQIDGGSFDDAGRQIGASSGIRYVPRVKGDERNALTAKLADLQGRLAKSQADAAADAMTVDREVSLAGQGIAFNTSQTLAAAFGASGQSLAWSELQYSNSAELASAPAELRGQTRALGYARTAAYGVSYAGSMLRRGVSAVGRFLARGSAQSMADLESQRVQALIDGDPSRAQELEIERNRQVSLNQNANSNADSYDEFTGAKIDNSAARAQGVFNVNRSAVQAGEAGAFRHFTQLNGIRIGIATQNQALRQQLDHNPIGAASIMMVGAAEAAAWNLSRAGLREEAGGVLANARLQQSLTRQEYLESFRASSFDLRENAIGSRDTEDTGKVLQTIDANIQKIADAVDRAKIEG